MRQEVENVDWPELFNNQDANESWNSFTGVIDDIIKRTVPCRTPRTSKRPPWMNRDIMKAVRSKRTRWRTYTRTTSKQDYNEYKKSEKEVKQG